MRRLQSSRSQSTVRRGFFGGRIFDQDLVLAVFVDRLYLWAERLVECLDLLDRLGAVVVLPGEAFRIANRIDVRGFAGQVNNLVDDVCYAAAPVSLGQEIRSPPT